MGKLYSFTAMVGIFTSYLMIYDIIKNPVGRFKKLILLIFFYAITILINKNTLGYTYGEWKVIPFAVFMLADALILTWFVSGYRLLNDQFEDASIDIDNSISNLIVRTDKNLRILNMNNAATDILGNEISNIYDLLQAKTTQNVPKALRLLMSGQMKSMEIDLDHSSALRNFVVKSSPYIWRGKDIGYSLIFSDITSLKEKEKLLAQSNSTKDQLFSILAHDLRKPALAFRGITKKINYLLHKRDFESLDRLGNSIEQSSHSLNVLLENLLNWALSQKNMISVNRKSINVKSKVEEVLKMLQISIQQKDIKIDTEEVDENLQIYSDPDILITILRNIVDNAIKYSAKGSQIRVSTVSFGKFANINIRDFGVGMSQEEISKLSRLYQNKSQKGTLGERGSGLGLTLVYELIEKIDGTISIKSELNQGSEITVILPNT